MRSFTVLSVALLLGAFSIAGLAAEDKPNFSGEWKWNAAKSDVGGQPMEDLKVSIEHKEPSFKFTATGTAGGEEFTETGSVTTDGKETEDSNGMLTKAHWDGVTLVFEFHSADGSVTGTARHTLSADGKTQVREAFIKSPDGEVKQHIVMDKQ